MDKTTEEIAERVRKLLRLAQSDNVHEAAAAAAAAQELAERHRLTPEALAEGPGEFRAQTIETMPHVVEWRVVLAQGIANANGCDVVTWKRTQDSGELATELIVVGPDEDRQTCAYLYSFLATEVDRLAGETADTSRRFRNGFRIGAAIEIRRRLARKNLKLRRDVMRAAEKQGDDGQVALVSQRFRQLDDVREFIEETAEVERGRDFSPDKDWRAVAMGVRAGSSIQLVGDGRAIGPVGHPRKRRAG
jgi:hypothetical protein